MGFWDLWEIIQSVSITSAVDTTGYSLVSLSLLASHYGGWKVSHFLSLAQSKDDSSELMGLEKKKKKVWGEH